jgi:primosomal protein N' (replication factor Y)
VGVGTEAIEESLKTHYPHCRTLRLDRDVVTHPSELEEVLAKFRNREADVLVGTQMVAKGHDFPSVSLVGILLGDLGLCVPDFRSHERALQLLLQVSGRAGRAAIAGRVLLQAFDPSHPVFEALVKQRSLDDYGTFLDHEIALRKPFGYPPFGRLVLLRFSGLSAPQVREAADTVCRGLKRATNEITVLGPVASPIGKIKNNYRFQALIKSPAAGPLQKAIGWIWAGWVREKLEQKYRTRFVIDVDPVQML